MPMCRMRPRVRCGQGSGKCAAAQRENKCGRADLRPHTNNESKGIPKALLSRAILVMARVNVGTTFGDTFKEKHDGPAHGSLSESAAS